jgi:hypothetical protein
MKKCIYLLSFLLVAFSFAANMVEDVFVCNMEYKLAEKEKAETSKETDESDLDKDKILARYHNVNLYLNTISCQHLHPTERIISSFLEKDINPPDLMHS